MTMIAAQLRPSGTSATALYTRGSQAHDRQYGIGPLGQGMLHIANTSGAAATARVFVCPRGDDFDEEHAIEWDLAIPIDRRLTVLVPALTQGQIGVRTSVGDALTFTLEDMGG